MHNEAKPIFYSGYLGGGGGGEEGAIQWACGREHIFIVLQCCSCRELSGLVLHLDNSLASVLSFEQSQEGIKHLIKSFSNSFSVFQLALTSERGRNQKS